MKYDIDPRWSDEDILELCAGLPKERRRILLSVVLDGKRGLTSLERCHVSLARRKDFEGRFPWSPPEGMGHCTNCGEYGEIPYDSWCRECKLEANKVFHYANPEYQRMRSARYRLDNPEMMRKHSQNRRARIANAPGDGMSAERKAELEGSTCHWCDGEFPGTEYPDPLMRSLEHIIPLISGGSHSDDNLAWAHLRCNKVNSSGARATNGATNI
jgi:hypothetical protein